MHDSEVKSQENTKQKNDPYYKTKTPKKEKGFWEKLGEMGTVSQKEIVQFTRHLSVMISSGVTIFEAVKFLKNNSKNKVFASKLKEILDSLNNGKLLSVSMKRFPKIFPEIYTNIINVGEESGSLADTMTDLANYMEDSDKFKRKVKGALIYPKIIVSVMILFMLVLFFFVMPRILTVFDSLNAEIPTATKVTIAITNFMRGNILLIIGGIIGFIILTKLIFRNKKAQRARDLLYIKLPAIGRIVLGYNTAQVSQHFGTLFASGLTIVRCLEITQSVIKNHIFKEELGVMVNKIKNGSSLSQSFPDKTHFPPMFIKLIKVGEKTGKLPFVIDYTKTYYKGIVDEDVTNISTIIEPVVMLTLGIMIAGLVITVIGPIYQLISNVST